MSKLNRISTDANASSKIYKYYNYLQLEIRRSVSNLSTMKEKYKIEVKIKIYIKDFYSLQKNLWGMKVWEKLIKKILLF